jgi:hypothetical protein
MGEYEGSAKVEDRPSFTGKSKVSFEDALKAAVHRSGADPDTVFTVTFAVTTEGDPKIGEYHATIVRG